MRTWLVIKAYFQLHWWDLKDAWAHQALAKQTLKNRGCVCFCPSCYQVLDSAEKVGDVLYRYSCECGRQSTFDFGYPVPVRVKEA